PRPSLRGTFRVRYDRGIYLVCAGRIPRLGGEPNLRLRPGETDKRPAVVELEPPSVDSADVPSECPQGRVEPGFNRLAFRRIVHDRSAKHRIPGDFLHHHIEWAGRDHRD